MGHCCNLMKQSTTACFASGVQSALLYVRRPRTESSERRSVLVLWPGCYQSFYPPEEWACHTAPSLFFPFFLHLCHSLRAMQMHATYPSSPPTTRKPPSLSWESFPQCEWAVLGAGRIRESGGGGVKRHFMSSHQLSRCLQCILNPSSFKVVKSSSRATVCRVVFKGRHDQLRPPEALEESHASVSDFEAINNL